MRRIRRKINPADFFVFAHLNSPFAKIYSWIAKSYGIRGAGGKSKTGGTVCALLNRIVMIDYFGRKTYNNYIAAFLREK